MSKIEFEKFEFVATDNLKYLGSIVLANGSSDWKFDKRIIEGKKVIGWT